MRFLLSLAAFLVAASSCEDSGSQKGLSLQVGAKPAILFGCGCAFGYQRLMFLFWCRRKLQPDSSVSAPTAAVFSVFVLVGASGCRIP